VNGLAASADRRCGAPLVDHGRAALGGCSEREAAAGERVAVLAADLGGSALKVGLVDDRGRPIAAAVRPLGESRPAPGLVEQDAELWWTAFVALARELCAANGRPIEAIALTGATRSEVLVDGEGRPLAPAIMFRDQRAAGLAEALAADPALAAAGPIDASHPLARILWLHRHARNLLERAARILEPAPFLAFRLTGSAVRDPLAAKRLDDAVLRAVAERFGLPLHLLPPVRPIGSAVGALRAEAARALGLAPGIPVVVAPMDAWCATLAMGAVEPGRAYASAGSSLVTGLLVDRPIVAPGLLAPPWGDGLWHLGGPSRTGGAALDWLARLSSTTVEALLTLAERVEERDDAPFSHPWPAGERVPFLASGLRGRFWNLGGEVGPGDLACAVLEGLAFWLRLTLDRAEEAAGVRAPTLRLTGGLAANPIFTRCVAAALGRDLLLFPARETALLGAAGLALVAIGRYADLGAVQAALTTAATPVRIGAEPRRIERAERRFLSWKEELDRVLSREER